MTTLKQYNNPFEEQEGNSCTISCFCMAVENMYNQTYGNLKLDRKEIGRKLSMKIHGDRNLIFTLGGNLRQVVEAGTKIDIRDSKGNKIIVHSIKEVKISYEAIQEELEAGRPILYSGLGSLSKKGDKNIFYDKGNMSSHAMLLDTLNKDTVEFQNSLNLMERVEATKKHILEKTLNFWSFKIQLKISNNNTMDTKITQKLSNEKHVSKPEDQKRGSSCTMFSFENKFSIEMNRNTGKNNTNLNEYDLNSQVEIFHGLPLGYINKNGFNPERILECFSEIEIGNTGIKIKKWDRLYLGNQSMAVHGIMNAIWKGGALIVGCKGHSFKNENGDWEWEYKVGSPVYYHEMTLHSFVTKNGVNYFVCENSYTHAPRMYMKVEDVLNIVQIAHTFELDFTNAHVEIIKRGDAKREITFEQLETLKII